MSELFTEIRCVFPGVDNRTQDAAVRCQYPLGSAFPRGGGEVEEGRDRRDDHPGVDPLVETRRQ